MEEDDLKWEANVNKMLLLLEQLQDNSRSKTRRFGKLSREGLKG